MDFKNVSLLQHAILNSAHCCFTYFLRITGTNGFVKILFLRVWKQHELQRTISTSQCYVTSHYTYSNIRQQMILPSQPSRIMATVQITEVFMSKHAWKILFFSFKIAVSFLWILNMLQKFTILLTGKYSTF